MKNRIVSARVLVSIVAVAAVACSSTSDHPEPREPEPSIGAVASPLATQYGPVRVLLDPTRSAVTNGGSPPYRGDTLRQGAPNSTETGLRVQQSGKNRGLARFGGLAALPAGSTQFPPMTTAASATLTLTITDNGNNWGTSGRAVAVHRLLHDYETAAVTWNCSNDTNVGNSAADCSGATAWDMDHPDAPALWNATPSATAIVTSDATSVSFDVTADVNDVLSGAVPNYGWVIKKVDEGAAGRIDFTARLAVSPPDPQIDPVRCQHGAVPVQNANAAFCNSLCAPYGAINLQTCGAPLFTPGVYPPQIGTAPFCDCWNRQPLDDVPQVVCHTRTFPTSGGFNACASFCATGNAGGRWTTSDGLITCGHVGYNDRTGQCKCQSF